MTEAGQAETAKRDRAGDPSQAVRADRIRRLALVGTLCSLPGAGFVVFLGSFAEEYDDALPGEWVILLGLAGLLSGGLALSGLALRLWKPTIGGAALQALVAATLLVWVMTTGGSGAGWYVAALVGVMFADALASYWAWRTVASKTGP